MVDVRGAAKEPHNSLFRLLEWAATHNKIAATLVAGAVLVIVGVYFVRAMGVPPGEFLMLALLLLAIAVVVQLLVTPKDANKSAQRHVIEWGVTGMLLSGMLLLLTSSAFGFPDERACLMAHGSQECRDAREMRKKVMPPDPAATAPAPAGIATDSAATTLAEESAAPDAAAAEAEPAAPDDPGAPSTIPPGVRNPGLVLPKAAAIDGPGSRPDLVQRPNLTPQIARAAPAQLQTGELRSAAPGPAMPSAAFAQYRVFIQFSGYNRQAVTVPLSTALMESGWSVAGGDAGGQRLAAAEGYNEVRYRGAASLPAAQALAEAINATGRLPDPLRVVESRAVAPGTLEIWMSH